jgi:hypothetical protein
VDELVIWICASLALAQDLPEEELPDASVEFTREKPPEQQARSGPTLGLALGVGLPKGSLQAGLAPRLELGLRPRALDGRLHVGASAAWQRSTGTLLVTDERLEDPWGEDLLQHTLTSSLAVSFRLLGESAKASPELRAGPQLAYSRTLVGEDLLGAGLHLGALGELGLSVTAGPGQLRLGLALDVLGTDPLTGLARQWTLTPALAYRMVL